MSDIKPDPAPPSHIYALQAMAKRAPWVEIAVITGAVALLTIGALAHFNVLNHVGSMSNTAIQYTTFGGAGGLVALDYTRLIGRRMVSQSAKIDFSEVEEPD